MMNFDKILTVIVPSYNMEALLRKNLQSLLISKNPQRLEVIVVNDGSKDRTLAIARDFECRYPDIFKVIDKENGNYGSCINIGLKIATGKYIKILDADDSFITENFEQLVDALSNNDADMFFTDLVKEYISGEKKECKFDLPVRKIVDIQCVCDSNAFIDIQMPAITYRTELLKTINYHQTEGISYTDLEWCFSPVIMVKTVYYLNITVYKYLLGREGQTMDSVVIRKRILHTIKSCISMLHSIENVSIPAYLENFINTRLFLRAVYIYDFYLLDSRKKDFTILHTFDAELKRYRPNVYALCGNCHYRKHLPYCYIAKWRNGKKNIPLLIKLLSNFFDMVVALRSYLHKN